VNSVDKDEKLNENDVQTTNIKRHAERGTLKLPLW